MHYAIKPLPHEAVISTLRDEGAGFDLATNGEVDLVRGQNVDPTTCIHTHPIKRAGDIEYPLEYGCNTFVFDNIHELEKFKSYRKKVKLLLRVSFPNPESKADLSKKFGCTPAQAMELLQWAKNLGIEVIGLSFHVGSQVNNAKRHVEAIEQCKKILNQA